MDALYVVRREDESRSYMLHPAVFFADVPDELQDPSKGWLENGVWRSAGAMVLQYDEAKQVIAKFPDAEMVRVG